MLVPIRRYDDYHHSKNSMLLNYCSFNFNIIYCEIKSYRCPGIFIINIQSLKPLPPSVASSKFHVSSSKNMLFKVSSQNQGTCLCPPWPLGLGHPQGQIDKKKKKKFAVLYIFFF